jgi:hypothetical protein
MAELPVNGLTNKTVYITRITSAGKRCGHCFLLDEYFKRLPKSSKERDIFYLRPLTKIERGENFQSGFLQFLWVGTSLHQ